jgi:hypothetical protein
MTSWAGRNIFIGEVSCGRNRNDNGTGVIPEEIARGAKTMADGGILYVVKC